MQTRRAFVRRAAALSAGAFWFGAVPEGIARALTIDPPAGTTFRDAEHVVILMQENRSFDHAFGALRGVRGFRDPRAHVLPNGHRVWFQTDERGYTYAPTVNEADHTAQAITELLSRRSDRAGVLTRFISSLPPEDEALLQRLLRGDDGP